MQWMGLLTWMCPFPWDISIAKCCRFVPMLHHNWVSAVLVHATTYFSTESALVWFFGHFLSGLLLQRFSNGAWTFSKYQRQIRPDATIMLQIIIANGNAVFNGVRLNVVLPVIVVVVPFVWPLISIIVCTTVPLPLWPSNGISCRHIIVVPLAICRYRRQRCARICNRFDRFGAGFCGGNGSVGTNSGIGNGRWRLDYGRPGCRWNDGKSPVVLRVNGVGRLAFVWMFDIRMHLIFRWRISIGCGHI